MIQEDYVSFETAKLLKERGFDEYTLLSYDKNGNNKDALRPFLESEGDVRRPTLQMAMKWLREVHNIFISIVFCTYPTAKRVTWTPEISTFDSVFPESAIEYDSHEQACEAAIRYCLENLI